MASGGIERLKRLRYVIVAGAPLRGNVATLLTDNGVSVVQNYGMTETGCLLMSPLVGSDWRDLRPVVPDSFWHLNPTSGELVVHLDCPTLNVRVEDEFLTADIFQLSPSGGYQYQGRQDDLIVQASGEKSNPVVMEQMIMQQLPGQVEQAAVVGKGRLYLACLLQLSEGVSEEQKPGIIAVIEQLNEKCPHHSRLLRDMLLFIPSNNLNKLPLSDKRTLLRNKVEQVFSSEIDQLYSQVRYISSQSTLESFFDHPESLDPDLSLFSQGVDSLATVQFGLHIAALYPERTIPPNIVYQYPTLTGLKAYLSGSHAPESRPRIPPTFSSLRDDKANWEYAVPRSVLLTGASGFLGQELLLSLLSLEHVDHVHCPIRKLSSNLRASDRVTYYADYDFQHPLLGLQRETYNTLLESVDTVIHAAWPMNFNAPYNQLAESALASVTHLIDFCRHRQKTLNFMSSLATVMVHPTKSRVDEDLPLSTDEACFPHGYAQTKWEAEHVIIGSGIPYKIFRLGQISAHSVTAQWNNKEHIPVLLDAAQSIGCTPLLPFPIAWVPVDIACQAIVELLGVPRQTIHHIVNPQPRTAECLALGSRSLPLKMWLSEIEPVLDRFPRVMAIWPFLDQMAALYERLVPLSGDKTVLHSRTLARCEPISDEYISRLMVAAKRADVSTAVYA